MRAKVESFANSMKRRTLSFFLFKLNNDNQLIFTTDVVIKHDLFYISLNMSFI